MQVLSVDILLHFVVDDGLDLLYPVIACNTTHSKSRSSFHFLVDDSILFTPHNCS